MGEIRHAADGRIHYSELREHRHSAAHARLAFDSTKDRSVTRPMLVGSITDDLIFHRGRNISLYPGAKRQGKEWDAFKIEHAGQIMCIQSELDDATGAAQAVLADPVAQRHLDGAEFQRVMQWDAHGFPCAAGIPGERGGFDVLQERAGTIWDLKCTASSDPEELSRQAWRMLWHAQGAWYVDGARALSLDVNRFGIIAVESTPPHCVTCMRIPESMLERGRQSIRLWIEQHRACELSDVWPGYVQSEIEMTVPEWLEAT